MVLERSNETASVSTLSNKLVQAFSEPLTSVPRISYNPRSYNLFWINTKAMSVMAENLRTRARVTVLEDLVVPLSLLVVPEHNRLLIGQPNLLSSYILGPQSKTEGISSDHLSVTTFSRPTCLAYSSKMNTVFVADNDHNAIYRQVLSSPNISSYALN